MSPRQGFIYLSVTILLIIMVTVQLKSVSSITDSRVPYDFYRQVAEAINNITDISEFIEQFSTEPQLENGKQKVKRAAVMRATAASCIPASTVVELTPSNAQETYIPHCTRVKRCGGCCNHPSMSCQPTKTETLDLRVIYYTTENYIITSKGQKVIPVEEHLECKCESCHVKAEHCKSYQHYENCGCHCIDKEAKEMCRNLIDKKWDDENCRCVCKDNRVLCTTGSYYDESLCRCVLW